MARPFRLFCHPKKWAWRGGEVSGGEVSGESRGLKKEEMKQSKGGVIKSDCRGGEMRKYETETAKGILNMNLIIIQHKIIYCV